MSEIIGKQLEVGLGVEVTRGTAPATAGKWIKNVSASVIEKAEHVDDESVRGVFEDMDGRRVVKKFIEGDIEMNLYANAFGFLAYNLYGDVSSSLVATGVYDHVFGVAQSSLAPSLAVYAKDGDVQQLAYQNAHINTLEVTSSVDSYVNVTAGFMAKDGVANSDTPSYSTDYDFVGKEVSVKVANTEAGLSSATPLCVKELSLTFDKGLISDHCLGAYTPNDIYMSKMSIEGSFQKNFVDETFKDLFLGNSAIYMQITITGETVIGASSYPTLTFVFNKVQIKSWERSGGKDDLVVEDVEFKAYYNETDGEASTLTLRNTTAEYVDEVSL